MTRLMRGLFDACRSMTRHLPEQAYPSDHPWRLRHDPERPRG